MMDASGESGQSDVPWHADEGWLAEPVFDDVPFEQSGWKPIVEVLERVNLAKARLLISIYEAQVRCAYQRYRAIREEEFERFHAERREAEQRNDALRAQIREVERAMEQIRARWQPKINELSEQLYPAWQDAYTKAAQAGINLRGDPLMDDTSEPSPGSPTIPTTELLSSAGPAEQSLPTMSAVSARQPPPLTPAEVMHAQNLPSYQGYLIPKPVWAVLVVFVGLGLGFILSLTTGLIVPGQPLREPLPVVLALVAGVALTYLWVRALWGATATIAELYHLFGWHEGKAHRAAWSIGTGLMLLILTAGLWGWLLLGIGRASVSSSGWMQLGLWAIALLMLPLLACAMLEGFLEGRYKPIGHWVAACITQQEREQFQRASETESRSTEAGDSNLQNAARMEEPLPTSAASPALAEAEREAWVSIRRYQALSRQCNYLKSEMEQELMPYREQIEQLKAEMRPRYPTLPPHSRNRIALAYCQWFRMYRLYLHHLANALRECQGGEELAAIVLEHLRHLANTPRQCQGGEEIA